MSVLVKNFINILRHGAFEDRKPIGMLSAYKWSQLTKLAEHHHVLSYYATGIEKYFYDDNLNIPQKEIDTIKGLLASTARQSFFDLYSFDKLYLYNKHHEHQLADLIKKEYADEEQSYVTRNLLAVIIQTINNMYTGKSYIRGIIDMGILLRNDGDRVDFVKLENWLKQTNTTRLANLQGRMLIDCFGFNVNEIPFSESEEKHAEHLLQRDLHCHATTHLKTWEYRPGHNGFSSGVKTAFRTIGHAMSFYRYSPSETTSSITRGILKGIQEIEE